MLWIFSMAGLDDFSTAGIDSFRRSIISGIVSHIIIAFQHSL